MRSGMAMVSRFVRRARNIDSPRRKTIISMEGRDILSRRGTLAEFIAKGELPHEPEPAPNETFLNPE